MKKNLIMLIIFSVLSTTLISCSEYNDLSTNGMNNIEDNLTYAGEEHYKKILANNIKVDAEVNIPKVEEINVINAKFKSFDVIKFKEVFLNGKEITEEKFNEGDKYSSLTNFTTNDERLTIKDMEGVDFAKKRESEIFSLLGALVESQAVDIELSDNDLNFAGKEEVKYEIYNLLEGLDIKSIDEESFQVKSLDNETIKELCNIAKEMQLGKGKFNYEPSGEDEAYYFTIKNKLHNIPLISEDLSLETTNYGYYSTNITGCYTDKGLAYIKINNIYQEESIKDEANVITVDQALEAVKNIYSNLLVKQSFIIKGISLEYVPNIISEDEGKYELIPSYKIDVEIVTTEDKSGKEVESINNTFLYINGLTGKRII